MLLLDTQAVLWTLDRDRRLGQRARERIVSSRAYVSAASIFELAIKSMLGKLEIPDDIRDRIAAEGFAELPVTSEHANAVRDFPELIRHDPFDRLLVAQSACAGIDLLTADRVLLGLGRRHIVDATA